MRKYKMRKLAKWIAIGALLTLLTLLAVVSVFLWLLAGYPGERSRNIKEYEDMLANDNLTTGLMIFPEQIPDSATEIEYSYRFYYPLGSPSYEIFLQCTYDEEDYRAEIDRLENISKQAGSRVLRPIHDEDGKYPYPAYITVENFHHCYEYALLSEANQITYISTAYYDREEISFDEKYLPTDYMTDVGRSYTSGYSIYAVSVFPSMIDFDYTRATVAEVLDGHSRFVEYGFFMVRTQMDEQDREVIRDCVFAFVPDVDSEEAKEDVEYHEIDGCIYKHVELNEERTHAIITYIEDNEEKILTIELPKE